MTIQQLRWFVIILLFTGYISGCSTSRVQTIKDIAFDVNKNHGYTVYITEGSRLVPYLVLTADYNGNTLLLRKHVLDEDNLFNDIFSSYYRDSYIDRFLNSEFIATLDPDIQKLIVASEIEIAAEPGIDRPGRFTENITRNIFLLSATEAGWHPSNLATEEGTPLRYFKAPGNRIFYENRIACGENGELRIWWLRSKYHSQGGGDDLAWVVGPSGGPGSRQVGDPEQLFPTHGLSGVRPAFCLPGTLLIEESDQLIEGQTVYVIAR